MIKSTNPLIAKSKLSSHFDVLRLDSLTGGAEYVKTLKEIDNSSPFYTLAFVKCFSEGLENLICFKWQCDNKKVLLIGYLKSIGNYLGKDFSSPYGYSGPIFSEDTKEKILVGFWKEVNKWLKANGIVSSFIRFSLTNNWSGAQVILKKTLLNVKGVIREEERQWDDFEPKVRKNVKKAIREGLISQVVKGNEIDRKQLLSFYGIYTTTLSRNSVTKKNYSSLDDFEQYCKLEADSCLFAFVFDADVMIAAEMVLLSDQSLYSFLGGTVQSAFSKRPNDLLKYTLINWARDNGYRFFVLGGGLSKEDGIYKYKKSFFPDDIMPFYTGRKIFDKKKYEQLSDHAKQKLTNEEKVNLYSTDFFPAYRYSPKENLVND